MNFFDYFKNVVDFPVSSKIILKSEIDGNKVITDKCFIGSDYKSSDDTAAIKIVNGTIVFIRCIFKDFTYPLMFCKGYCRVIFKKCYFENICDGITASDKAVIEMYHCRFEKVSEACLNFMKHSSFTITNSKFLSLTGSGIVMVDKSSGCIEESSFYANKGCGPIAIGCRVQGKNRLSLNKCKFQDLGIAIASSKRGYVFSYRCQFKRNKSACLALDSSVFFICDCYFVNQADICCYLKNTSDLTIYDSVFNNNFKECVVGENTSVINIKSSTFSKNIGNCIDISDDVNCNLSECSIGNNNCAGLFQRVRSISEVSRCKIFDNVLGNVITTLLTQGNFSNNEIFYSGPSFVDGDLINVHCFDCSKCHFDNDHIYGYGQRKTVIGIVASNTANVFIRDCLLRKLGAVAIYEDDSSIYITDAIIKDFYEVYAMGDDTATLGLVRCRYEDFDSSLEFEEA